MGKGGDQRSNKVLRNFLNPCMGSSLRDAMLMIAVVQMLFAFAYLIHGGFLCKRQYEVVYGVPYIIAGIIYFFTSPAVWRSAKQPKPEIAYFRSCIFFLVLAQLIILAVTISRNVKYHQFIWAVNIWIFCGLFIQCYILWIVHTFMNHDDDEEDKPVMPPPGQEEDPCDTSPPPAVTVPPQSPSPPENENADNGNEDDTVIIESANSYTPEPAIAIKMDDGETKKAEDTGGRSIKNENGATLDKEGTAV